MVGGYGELAFQFGLADESQKKFINEQCESVVSAIQRKDFMTAFKVMNQKKLI